jgi:hypothetical protein
VSPSDKAQPDARCTRKPGKSLTSAAFRIHATACVITFSACAIAVGGKHFTYKRNDFFPVEPNAAHDSLRR